MKTAILESFDLLDLLQITDRSFPTGSFVHSHGLEWLVQQQMSLESTLQMRLREQLAHFELVFVLQAYEQATVELDERFDAMLLPREARLASTQVGRQLLRNACDLFGNAELAVFEAQAPYAHHPVVFGLVSSALGVPPVTAATTYAFQTVRGQISAAQRLTRLGQVEAQRLLHSLKPAMEEAVTTAQEYPFEEVGPFMPILDIASMAHERMEVRLFVS